MYACYQPSAGLVCYQKVTGVAILACDERDERPLINWIKSDLVLIDHVNYQEHDLCTD